MKKLVCYFSGWFDCDLNTILVNPMTNETNTVEEWLKLNRTQECPNGSIDGLMLESFNDARDNCLNSEFDDLDLTLEDDEGVLQVNNLTDIFPKDK